MLNEKAVLTSLNIGRPGTRKKDTEVSEEVLRDKGAARDTGAFHKELFDKDDTRVKALTAAVSEARTYHAKVTLPWGNRGTRVLPSALLLDYTDKINAMKKDFWDAADDFLAGVASMQLTARSRLGSLYNADDYPDVDTLRSKFKFEIALDPLATENDFRIDIGEDEKRKLRDQYALQVEDKLSRAMSDVWERLYAAVEAMAGRLSEPDTIFKQSLVGNLQELTAMLPALNLSGDQKLTDMSNAVEALLCGYDPKTLRKDKSQREEAARNAKDIMVTMADYMGKILPEDEPKALAVVSQLWTPEQELEQDRLDAATIGYFGNTEREAA